jgi:hypothetical protein
MSGAGARRPVVTRGVFAIEDHELLLPDPIALDTSFVVEALLTIYTDRSRLASCRIKRAH